MTGAELYLLFQEATHKRYSNYVNPDRFNRLVQDVIIQMTERLYTGLHEQKKYDELTSLIHTDKNISPHNNRFSIGEIGIIGVTNVVNLVTITTTLPHNLAVGDSVTISDVAGITGVNGTFTVLQETPNHIIFDAGATPTGTYTLGTGKIRHDRMLFDYYHVFTILCEVLDNKHREQVVSGIAGSSGFLVVNTNTKIRSGQKIKVSGVAGMGNTNGDQYAKMIDRKRFKLFQDEMLLTENVMTGTYAAGNGIVQLYHKEYAHDLRSDKKASKSSRPTAELPTFIEDRRSIIIGPTGHECKNVWVDYMTQPPLVINAHDTLIDIDNYYSPKLQNRIKNECVVEFHKRMANQRGGQEAKENMIVNP